jgi:hypothetical protein
MANKFSKLVFSMEGVDDTTNVNPEAGVEVPAEVESEVGELNEAHAEVDGLADAIDATVDDAGVLEDVSDKMAESVESGEGLSPEAAEMAEIAVEAVCSRLGIDSKGIFLGTESFGATGTRLSATRVSLEGVMDSLKRAWEAIKKAFFTMVDKLKALWKRFFDANTKLGNSAKAMSSAAGKMGSKVKKETAFENESLYRAFSVGGAAVNAGEVIGVLKNHIKVTESAVKFVENSEKALEGINKAMETLKEDKEPAGAAYAEMMKTAVASVAAAVSAIASETKGDEHFSPALVGNVRLKATVLKDPDADKDFVKFEVEELDKGDSSAKPLPVLSGEEIIKITAEVQALSKATDGIKAKMSIFEKFEKTMNSTIDKAIAKVGKLDHAGDVAGATKADMEAIRRATAQIGNTTARGYAALPKLSIQAQKAALNYCAASMKLYGDKKD